jgi:hypothetical protein
VIDFLAQVPCNGGTDVLQTAALLVNAYLHPYTDAFRTAGLESNDPHIECCQCEWTAHTGWGGLTRLGWEMLEHDKAHRLKQK